MKTALWVQNEKPNTKEMLVIDDTKSQCLATREDKKEIEKYVVEETSKWFQAITIILILLAFIMLILVMPISTIRWISGQKT